MNYYKITSEEAELIGNFFYGLNSLFNPHVGEQTDGSFLISEEMYELLKDREEFQRVDFSGKEKINQTDLNTKPTEP